MSGQRTVSIQEAVHMIDGQELVLTSDHITHVSLHQGATLKKENDVESRDIVSRYRNRPKKYHHLSLETYFYKVFCREILNDNDNNADRTKHRMLVPKGMKCKPTYPATFEYARGMLIMHKPWSEEHPLTKLLEDETKTVRTFQKMVDKLELPSSVIAQYICAMKYKRKKSWKSLPIRERTRQLILAKCLTDKKKNILRISISVILLTTRHMIE